MRMLVILIVCVKCSARVRANEDENFVKVNVNVKKE
jgi:hypothetical protein